MNQLTFTEVFNIFFICVMLTLIFSACIDVFNLFWVLIKGAATTSKLRVENTNLDRLLHAKRKLDLYNLTNETLPAGSVLHLNPMLVRTLQTTIPSVDVDTIGRSLYGYKIVEDPRVSRDFIYVKDPKGELIKMIHLKKNS